MMIACMGVPQYHGLIREGYQMTTTTMKQAAIAASVTRDTNGLAVALDLAFVNGKRLNIMPDQLTDAIRYEALIHGLKQKLVDAAAMSRNPETGREASIDDKYAAVREVYDRLLAGEWNKAREGQSTGGLLLTALVRMYDGTKTREQLATWLEGKNKAEQAALRKNPKLAAIITEIQAERAGADAIDSDGLLDELE